MVMSYFSNTNPVTMKLSLRGFTVNADFKHFIITQADNYFYVNFT